MSQAMLYDKAETVSSRRFLPSTLVISMLLHTALLWSNEESTYLGDTRSDQRVLNVTISRAATQLQVTPESTSLPESLPESLPKPRPRPRSKSKIDTASAPKLTAEVEVELMPLQKTISKSEIEATPVIKNVNPSDVANLETVTEVSNEPRTEMNAEVRSNASQAENTVVLQMTESERQQYLRLLLAHIESHKYYPRSARSRGVEGYVNVSFVLSPEGELSAIEVEGGSAVLRRAAGKAIAAAQPLPQPELALLSALPVTYRMEFMLQ